MMWLLLYAVAFLTFGLLGFHNGMRGERNIIGLILLILSFSVVMFLIADLSEARSGALQVSQQALVDLQHQLSAQGP